MLEILYQLTLFWKQVSAFEMWNVYAYMSPPSIWIYCPSIFYSFFSTELENIIFKMFLQNLLKFQSKVLARQLHVNCLENEGLHLEDSSNSCWSLLKSCCSSV